MQLSVFGDLTTRVQGAVPIRPEAIRPAGECGPGGFTVTRTGVVVGWGRASWGGGAGPPTTAATTSATAPASRPPRLRFLIFLPRSMAASTGAAPGSTAENAALRSS